MDSGPISDKELYIFFRNPTQTLKLFSEDEIKRQNAIEFFEDKGITISFSNQFSSYRERLEYIMKMVHYGNLETVIKLNNGIIKDNTEKESILETMIEYIGEDENEQQETQYGKILDGIFSYYDSLSTKDKEKFSEEDREFLDCLKIIKDISIKKGEEDKVSVLNRIGIQDKEKFNKCKDLLKSYEGENSLGYDFNLDWSEYSYGFIRNKNLRQIPSATVSI